MRPTVWMARETGASLSKDRCVRVLTRLNVSASGQHEASAMRMRLAVSIMRAAIFNRRRRMVANSVCRSGCHFGIASRTSSSSQ